MSKMTINWPGSSGAKYKFDIYEIGTNFNSLPGNYVFSKETKPGMWAPIYIGQTKDLSERFNDHHKMEMITRHGATHIHVHDNHYGEQARLIEEADLIKRWSPPCNG